MARISENQNEYKLIRNVMIGLLVLNLSTLLFSYMVTSQTGSGGTGLGCGQYSYNATTHQIATSTNSGCAVLQTTTSLTNATQQFTSSFSYKPFKTCSISNVTTSNIITTLLSPPPACYNLFTPLTNPLADFFNTVSDIFLAIGYFFYIIGLIIALIFWSTIGLAPAVFYGAHLGIFSTLFTIVYGFSIAIVLIYAIYIILNRIQNTPLP